MRRLLLVAFLVCGACGNKPPSGTGNSAGSQAGSQTGPTSATARVALAPAVVPLGLVLPIIASSRLRRHAGRVSFRLTRKDWTAML